MSVILYGRLHMWQNGRLNPEFYGPVVKIWIEPSHSSVQSVFPKKNRSEGERGVCETHGYRNVAFTCRVYGIWALGIAGTHRQLCIASKWLMISTSLAKIYRFFRPWHIHTQLSYKCKWSLGNWTNHKHRNLWLIELLTDVTGTSLCGMSQAEAKNTLMTLNQYYYLLPTLLC